MNIDLHIERIVIDGLPPVQRLGSRNIGVALERELARLLANGGFDAGLTRGASVPLLSAPAISLDLTDNADALGRRIARSVHGTLTVRQPFESTTNR